MAQPARTALTEAARARAWLRDSKTRAAAPSPTTKPARCLSKGRQAVAGSPLIVARSPRRLREARNKGCMEASVALARTRSAWPVGDQLGPSDDGVEAGGAGGGDS